MRAWLFSSSPCGRGDSQRQYCRAWDWASTSCSEIVKAHGGTVGAHSEGRQTVFTVKLPKSAPAASAGLSPAA